MNIDVTESLADKVPYLLRMCNDEPLPSERIPPDAVSHVNECERTESVRKSFKDDKIPPVVREEVDRQIDQLREWGVREQSDSPMATPMVCALKKDQSIRLAVKCTEHPGACTSQKLSTAQQAWAVVMCGSYAVIWGLQKFRDMIFGSQAKNAPKSAELMRWLLAIQEFNVEIVYKRGVG
jgi:hypothetical protein